MHADDAAPAPKADPLQRLNLRVYGLWINAQQELLLAQERILGQDIVKFPGGGLELGEGVRDCLYREWAEEIGQPILACRHFYTTEFFQRSAFRASDQVISVYYLVESPGLGPLLAPSGEIQSFRWQALASLHPEMLSLPIDRYVAALLTAQPLHWPSPTV